MIPLGPILGVAGIAAATVLIPLGINYHDNGIRREYASDVRAQLAEQAVENQKQNQKRADVAEVKHNKEIEGYKEKGRADQREKAEMARTIQLQLDQNPLSVDASIAREFYSVMCKVKAGRNIGARQTCDIRAAEGDLARYSSVISVTAERIEEWKSLCEGTGSDDYCKPRVIGFAPGTMVQLIGWMKDVDTARMNEDANYDTIVTQINEILAMPGPTIKE